MKKKNSLFNLAWNWNLNEQTCKALRLELKNLVMFFISDRKRFVSYLNDSIQACIPFEFKTTIKLFVIKVITTSTLFLVTQSRRKF